MSTGGTSFRLSDEVKEQFMAIADSIGGTREQVIAKLMEAYMLQEKKVQLSDRSDQIEKFEQYMSICTRMFLATLEDYQNVKEAVKTEFIDQLKSKDQTISDLQEKLAMQTHIKEQVVEKSKEYKQQNVDLLKRVDQLEKSLEETMQTLSNRIKDKEETIQSLKEMNDNLKLKLADLDSLQTSCSKFEKQVRSLEETKQSDMEEKQQLNHTLEQQKEELDSYKNKIGLLMNQLQEEQLKQEHIKQEMKENAEARLQFEKEKMQVLYQKKLNEHYEADRIAKNQIIEEKQKQIEYYQQKYMERFEKESL